LPAFLIATCSRSLVISSSQEKLRRRSDLKIIWNALTAVAVILMGIIECYRLFLDLQVYEPLMLQRSKVRGA
jgi:hypothetical protein